MKEAVAITHRALIMRSTSGDQIRGWDEADAQTVRPQAGPPPGRAASTWLLSGSKRGVLASTVTATAY